MGNVSSFAPSLLLQLSPKAVYEAGTCEHLSLVLLPLPALEGVLEAVVVRAMSCKWWLGVSRALGRTVLSWSQSGQATMPSVMSIPW